MNFNNITYSQDGPVATITVNRPDKLNALNSETVRELTQAFVKVSDNKELRAVIVTGAGEKAFVAGADIAVMSKMAPAEAEEFALAGHLLMRTIEACPKPVIAAVNGFALGGGTELAIACDIIYASENAKFGLPEVKLGLYPGFGGTQRLMYLTGPARAKELIFSARVIDARTAHDWGIVNRVFALSELMAEAKKLAGEIAANGPVAVSMAKMLVNGGMDKARGEALDEERRKFELLFKTEDSREGLAAFLEKRKPDFKGS